MRASQRNKSEKGRNAFDLYPTPMSHTVAAVLTLQQEFQMLRRNEPYTLNVIDAGCGDGAWGTAMRLCGVSADVTGVEIREEATPDPLSYKHIVRGSYLDWSPNKPADMLIGNPPYSLAEPFLRRALSPQHLDEWGIVAMLLRLEFFASAKRGRGIYRENPPYGIFTFMQRPSFTMNGKTDSMEYAMFVWSNQTARLRRRGENIRVIADWIDVDKRLAEAQISHNGEIVMREALRNKSRRKKAA